MHVKKALRLDKRDAHISAHLGLLRKGYFHHSVRVKIKNFSLLLGTDYLSYRIDTVFHGFNFFK